MTIPPDFISADILPDKGFHLTIPVNVTMIVETEVQGQVQRKSCPGYYMGHGKWYYQTERGFDAVVKPATVTYWMVRT